MRVTHRNLGESGLQFRVSFLFIWPLERGVRLLAVRQIYPTFLGRD